MTEHATLRRLAENVIRFTRTDCAEWPDGNPVPPWEPKRSIHEFMEATTPHAVLALLDEVEAARAEQDGQGELLTIAYLNGAADARDAAKAARQEGYREGLEAAAKVAEGPVCDTDHNTGEARYRGDINGHHWEPPRPIAGYRGSEYGKARSDAAAAIRAMAERGGSEMTTRHRQKRSLIKCPQCGAWASSLEDRKTGCALRDRSAKNEGMCQQMRVTLLEMALRRALMPECFDERGAIISGNLLAVLDAEADAIRSAAALLGPVDATEAHHDD